MQRRLLAAGVTVDWRRCRRTLPVLLAVAGLGATALQPTSQAAAPAYTIAGPIPVATADPMAGCSAGDVPESGINYANAEVEPSVAVNPADADNIVGVVQQDPWSQGGAKGVTTTSSDDGGNTWTSSLPAFTACSGAPDAGPYTHATDPWVTFDATGNAYQISMSCECPYPDFAVLVSKSTDGGQTWGSPATLARDNNDGQLNDKPSIVGDPTRPGFVYAVWTHDVYPAEGQRNATSEEESRAERGDPMFSRTTDGGAHWSSPVSLLSGNPNIGTIGNVMTVLPDGTLVDVFSGGKGSGTQPAADQDFEAVLVSRDAGLTWTRPTKIANFVPLQTAGHNHLQDPDNGGMIRAGTNIPSVADDPRDGTIYVVWADGRFSNGTDPDVVLSRSRDGARSWSAPVRVNATPVGVAAFMPAVAVAADGTVGVSYYDLRNNTPATGLPTDVWFADSRDGGATWNEQHAGGPFDMETAPTARGYWVGDYEGIAASGDDFVMQFVMTTGNSADPTDVFSARASDSALSP